MYYIRKMTLRNWKNFNKVTLPIPNRLFIVGANASGKSNLMDAFRFLKDLTSDGLLKAVDNRGGISKLRFLNARDPSYIEIEVEILEETIEKGTKKKIAWEYLLQFNTTGGVNKTINVSQERIRKDDVIIKNRTYNDDGEDHFTRQYTLLEQPAINGDYRAIYDCFSSFVYTNIVPQLIKEPVPKGTFTSDDYFGSSLLDIIASTPTRTRTSRINSINRVLRLAVPQFSDLEFIQDEKGRPHLQVRYETYRPRGVKQLEDQFSDGTLRLIGILWAISSGDGLLLLEEPELYLHTELVKQLPAFIARAQKQKNGQYRQVIISSHSFDILNTDTISPDEIAVLNPVGESTDIKLAANIEEVKTMIDAGFTPADAVIPYVAPKGILQGQLSLLDFVN